MCQDVQGLCPAPRNGNSQTALCPPGTGGETSPAFPQTKGGLFLIKPALRKAGRVPFAFSFETYCCVHFLKLNENPAQKEGLLKFGLDSLAAAMSRVQEGLQGLACKHELSPTSYATGLRWGAHRGHGLLRSSSAALSSQSPRYFTVKKCTVQLASCSCKPTAWLRRVQHFTQDIEGLQKAFPPASRAALHWGGAELALGVNWSSAK